MSTLQEQAKALGEPTRHRIFRYVADADRPVDIAELTSHFGLHHNAIRQHLAQLVEAALLTESRAASSGRGRPRLEYRVSPSAEGRWDVIGPYERLSALLAEMLATGDTAIEVGRRSVERYRNAATPEADALALVTDAMERQGFDPVVRKRGARIEMVLRTCPFETTVLANPETVCALHLGMAQGLAAAGNGELAVDDLVANDPRRANCRLRMHLEPANG
jgi:predicted ArsR family transcriptional regulator